MLARPLPLLITIILRFVIRIAIVIVIVKLTALKLLGEFAGQTASLILMPGLMAALDATAPVKIRSHQVDGGTFGTIKVGFWQGRMVAVKVQDLNSAAASTKRVVLLALQNKPHPNIMQALCLWSTRNSRMMAFDWMDTTYNVVSHGF